MPSSTEQAGQHLHCSRLTCGSRSWSVHKKFCASLKSTSSEARPTREHRRVVYFPMESEEPVLLWCKFETFPRETLVAEDPGLLRLVTVGLGHSSEPKSTQVILNATREMSPGRFGHVLCNISFCAEDDVPTVWDPCLTNKSINALAEPGYSTPLMGPVITYAASRDVTSDELAVLDITMQDIRHTVSLPGFYAHLVRLYLFHQSC